MMDENHISMESHQEIDNVESGAEVTAVKLNVYSYFKARPEKLARSFDALMADKIQDFVGRQFVFDAWHEFVRTHKSGYFVIRGVPGIGKSAFLAKLINDRGYVHHFNIASQNIRSTRVFLENVYAQLIDRYKLGYAELPFGATEDSGFLSQCLAEAAADSGNRPVIIAIDALDEADRTGLPSPVNLLYLPNSLPEGVYVIATVRPLDDMHLDITRLQILDLEADSEGNLRDIETYITNHLAQSNKLRSRVSAWGVSEEHFVTSLQHKSQGNFMYLYHVLPAIEAGDFVKGTIDELPEGLMNYYRRHWRQMREGHDDFDIVYGPVVCILAVAQEPVTAQQVAAWTKLSEGQVKGAIREWRQFLEKEPGDDALRYRIYHASFQDFLKEQVDLLQYDSMIADYYLEMLDDDVTE